jgi:hypothetical protein
MRIARTPLAKMDVGEVQKREIGNEFGLVHAGGGFASAG